MARTSRKQIHQQTDLAQAPKTYLGGAYRRLSVEDDRHRDRHSLENQEKVADSYVTNRYGSWTAAQQFWQTHGWY